MNHSEAAHLGGLATAKKYGLNCVRCPLDGRLCEARLRDEKSEFHTENGRKGGLIGGQKGGEVTRRRHGKEFYSRIGKMGGRPHAG
ncbi:general stress protein [Candidatus Pacearchaeota archaeon]|nr:general stress protein [Candidatus Pacearchaeota archaeon]